MLYASAQDYLKASEKSVALFGMSGLGKTHLANLLRETGNWFHYSVDYRIVTLYMSEPIADNFKKEAMKSPLLRELLMTDSIYVASNITFENLSPLSTYLGKPGNPEKGGLAFEEYCRRQDEHRHAEIAAMYDAVHFRARAQALYGYDNFIADCSGSLCEVLGDDIASSDLMKTLSETALPVWIEGPKGHSEFLVERFKKAPKPMYYKPEFLQEKWEEYLKLKGIEADQVEPDDFAVWGYRALIDDRMPRYQSMAENWGISIHFDEVKSVKSAQDFNELIASKL